MNEDDPNFNEPDPYIKMQTRHINQDAPISEMDAFKLLFSDEWLRQVKAEINRYARQCQNDAQ